MLPEDTPEHGHCRSALRHLDRILTEKPERHHDELLEGMRCLVNMRNHLIARRRAGDTAPRLEQNLHQVNAVLSVLHSGAFPMVGMRHERLKTARDCLEALMEGG
ncbi:hypothetical protein [Azospirillum halopraeferens]|uniref:hypothetical protein n=1 Tax=Azospirillum halopraeferens TaxID=34010 RepID=UPI000425745D|nr:hypothetical protein [Azospirillum halopraeferens]